MTCPSPFASSILIISAMPAEYVPAGRELCLPESIRGGIVVVGVAASAACARPRTTAVKSIPRWRPVRDILLRYNIRMSESPTFQARDNLSKNSCCGQAEPACKTTESFARHVLASGASAALQPDRHTVEWISRRIYAGPVARPQTADAGCRSCHLPASLRKTGSDSMKHAGIISRAESLQILKKDLKKRY